MNSQTAMMVLSTLVMAVTLTGLASWAARKVGLLDIPEDRSSHDDPTPGGGGAGIVVALVIATFMLASRGAAPEVWLICIMPPALFLAVIGLIDDFKPLSAWVRLLSQVAAAIFLLRCAQADQGPLGSDLGVIQAIGLLLFLVWMTNFFNFMDGSNGMAGAQGVFAGFIIAWLTVKGGDPELALIACLIAVSCAGFLPWNLGKAKIFLGDVGSLSLGFILAALLVLGVMRELFSLPVALLVMMVFQIDATLTLLARVIKGERWYNPHKQHLYQQLIVHGWSHGRVLMLYQLINFLLVAPAIAIAVQFPALAWFITLTTALVFGSAWYLAIRRLGVLA